MAEGNKFDGPFTGNNQEIQATLLSLVQALNAINVTLAKLFPNALNTISASAGAATGDYLSVTVDGTTYKLALLAES